MSPRALRVTAIPFGLLAFAASVAVMFYAGVDWSWLAAAVVPLCLFFGFVAWEGRGQGSAPGTG
jgi:cell division protein FtsW (lipid II flippase)